MAHFLPTHYQIQSAHTYCSLSANTLSNTACSNSLLTFCQHTIKYSLLSFMAHYLPTHYQIQSAHTYCSLSANTLSNTACSHSLLTFCQHTIKYSLLSFIAHYLPTHYQIQPALTYCSFYANTLSNTANTHLLLLTANTLSCTACSRSLLNFCQHTIKYSLFSLIAHLLPTHYQIQPALTYFSISTLNSKISTITILYFILV